MQPHGASANSRLTRLTHYTGYMASRFHIYAGANTLLRGVAVLRAFPLLMLVGLCAPVFSAESSWLEVPFVHQAKAGCGSASIAMVMQYWASRQPGLDAAATDAGRIDRELPPTSSQGIQGEALKRYLEQHGFTAFVFSGEIRDLQQHIAKGRPVVVSLALNGARAPLHYVVVVGLNDKSVLVNDAARGRLIGIDRQQFLLAWKPTGNWALLAVPRTDSPPTRQPHQ